VAVSGRLAHLIRDFHQCLAAQPVGIGFPRLGELDDLRKDDTARGVVVAAAKLKNRTRLVMGALHHVNEVRIRSEILETFPARHSNFLSGSDTVQAAPHPYFNASGIVAAEWSPTL
jgi:hypothetical protein